MPSFHDARGSNCHQFNNYHVMWNLLNCVCKSLDHYYVYMYVVYVISCGAKKLVVLQMYLHIVRFLFSSTMIVINVTYLNGIVLSNRH